MVCENSLGSTKGLSLVGQGRLPRGAGAYSEIIWDEKGNVGHYKDLALSLGAICTC